MENKSIGEFIAVLRKAGGMTQRELAERLNVSDKAVSRWERGETLPDLTLIPIIADIFEVTADELLRGERNIANVPLTPYKAEKSEKQVRYIADKALTNFKIFSVISVAVALLGPLVAFILSFFTAYAICFAVACFFFVGATVCEIIFTALAVLKVKIKDEAVNRHKKSIVKISMLVFSFIIFLISETALFTASSGYMPQLSETAVLTVGPIILCLAVSQIIWYLLSVKGFFVLNEEEKERIQKLKNLKIKCAVILLCLALPTAWGQWYFSQFTSADELVKGTTFDNYKDFKAHMESVADKSPGEYRNDGSPKHRREITETENEYTETLYDKYDTVVAQNTYEKEKLTDKNGNVILKYAYNNHQISKIKFSDGFAELPVTVYTHEEMRQGYRIKTAINLAFIPLYAGEALIGYLVYRKKKNKI